MKSLINGIRINREVYVVGGCWLFVSLLFTIRMSIISGFDAYSFQFFVSELLYEVLCLSPWVAGIPFIVKVSEAFSWEEGGAYYLLHAVLAVIIFLFHSTVQTLVNAFYFQQQIFSFAYVWEDFLFYLDIRLLLYAGILVGLGYREYYRKRGELTIRKQQLKTELERARLSAVINEVQPDFLIKNINEVSVLIDRNAEKAEELLVIFSDLLRLLVRYSRKVDLSVAEDIKPYRAYTRYISTKFDKDIRFDARIADSIKMDTIPKSFLAIPLLDRIIDYDSERMRNSLESISYSVRDVDKRLSIRIELSDICFISKDQLTAIYRSFYREMREKSLLSEEVFVTSLDKRESRIILQMNIKGV